MRLYRFKTFGEEESKFVVAETLEEAIEKCGLVETMISEIILLGEVIN